jgi:hypothetical protein
MLGTNDQRIYGSNTAKQVLFRNGMYALAVYMSTDVTKAISGGIYSGTWGNTVAYGIGKYSDTQGSKLTFSASGPVIYLAYIKQVSNGGQFIVTIDGVNKGTFTSDGAGITTALGMTYGPQLARFDGLGSGSHVVEVEVISPTSSSNRVYIDYWATPSARNQLYIGNIPYATSYPSGGSNANVDAYNDELSRIVSTLSDDGLMVKLVDVNSALTPADMFDPYHPNDVGYLRVMLKYHKIIFDTCP